MAASTHVAASAATTCRSCLRQGRVQERRGALRLRHGNDGARRAGTKALPSPRGWGRGRGRSHAPAPTPQQQDPSPAPGPVAQAATDSTPVGKSGSAFSENLVTAGYIALWYAVNVCFNLTNKSLYKSFPFPWTVSTVHVVVGSIYCIAAYALGFKNASFGRPVTKDELRKISGPATMHALGHIAANLSFAAVAISLTHTVKTLEPAFSALLQYSILGVATPVPVLASLVPIIFGVGLVCASELSFNWLGFISAMLSNFTFGCRAVLSKQTMGDIKNLGSTALYAYTTVISVVICAPLALLVEGPKLAAGWEVALAKLGQTKLIAYLFAVGIFYHIYNQFAFNTLQRINPVSHGVCNVVKRIIIIGSSVVFFGNVLTAKTIIGTIIALLGTALYTELSSRHKHKQKQG